MSRRAFNPTAEQRGWVKAMVTYGVPDDEICLLIKNPQTGKPIDLETLRKHFAAEIARGEVQAKLLVNGCIIDAILGRDGGLLADRERVRLAILFAKTQMGWTAANRPKLVCDPIDGEDARRRLDNKIARLARGLKARGTGGSSAG
jgi:hypothetical protein